MGRRLAPIGVDQSRPVLEMGNEVFDDDLLFNAIAYGRSLCFPAQPLSGAGGGFLPYYNIPQIVGSVN